MNSRQTYYLTPSLTTPIYKLVPHKWYWSFLGVPYYMVYACVATSREDAIQQFEEREFRVTKYSDEMDIALESRVTKSLEEGY